MKRCLFFYILISVCFFSKAQITLVGHTMINNTPVNQVNITVKEGNTILKSFNTQSKKDFSLQLDFGKIYNVFFQYSKSPVMHLEIIANTIPAEKYAYMMHYELNVPFVY